MKGIIRIPSKVRSTLRNRYHVTKNRAVAKNVPFYWHSFEEFLRDVLTAIEDSPYIGGVQEIENIRISYDTTVQTKSGMALGYHPKTMVLSKTEPSKSGLFRGLVTNKTASGAVDDSSSLAIKILDVLLNGSDEDLIKLQEAVRTISRPNTTGELAEQGIPSALDR